VGDDALPRVPARTAQVRRPRRTQGAAGCRRACRQARPGRRHYPLTYTPGVLIYGRNAVLEALREGQVTRVMVARGIQPAALKELQGAARRAGAAFEEVPRIQLDQALRTTHHQGVAAELPEVPAAQLEDAYALAAQRYERLLLVFLDQLTDPRNVGAIIRSAEALGAHGVIMEERRSAPLSAVVVKASAGATSLIPIVVVTNLVRTIEQVKERGVWVYGAAPPANGEAATTP